MKRSPTTTNSPSRRTRFLACVEQRIAAGHSTSGYTSPPHLPTNQPDPDTPLSPSSSECTSKQSHPLEKKTPCHSSRWLHSRPQKTQETETHTLALFTHIFLSLGSFTSQCVCGVFVTWHVKKTMRGSSVSPFTLLWQYLLTNMSNWLFQTAWHERSFYHNANIRLMKKTEKKKTLVSYVYVRSHYPQPGSLFHCPRSLPPTLIRT